MKTLKLYILLTLIQMAILTSCSNGTSTNNSKEDESHSYSSPDAVSKIAEKDPYEVMNSVFVGSPEIEEIKRYVEGVLLKYNLPPNNEYRLKVGSMLLSLRKANDVGVTEMEILKHIYKYGSTGISLPDQAGISSTFLITSKR